MSVAGSDSSLPDVIFAQISPLSNGSSAGLFGTSDTITAKTVGNFVSSTDVIVQAVRGLRRAGFKVLQQTPLLLNIAGSAQQYEQFFRTRLETREVPVLKPGNRRDTAGFIDTSDNDTPGLLDTSRTALAGVLEGGALEVMRYPMQNALPPNPGYWHLDVPQDVARLLSADRIHAAGVTGLGTRLVMVDTGWFAHPWFAANNFSGSVVLGPGTSSPAQDLNGHGTGESANAFSVAPAIDFTMVKMDLTNTTGAFNTAAALTPQADVVSCSWGSDVPVGPLDPINQALAASIALAVANGIIVVFSAGNGHWGFPGQHPDVISAGGVFVAQDGSINASDYASGFASQIYPGRTVPDVSGLVGMQPRAIYLMLPVESASTLDSDLSRGSFPDGDETTSSDGWAAFSGTSAAAPQVAGACALLREISPDITPADAREALEATGVDVTVGSSSPDTGSQAATVGPDLATGAGLIDTHAAVEHIVIALLLQDD
jgi:hypothetical protein